MAEGVPTYNKVAASRLASRFGMNEVKYLYFTTLNRYLLTEDLNSCFVVCLMSPVATIAAHIPPHPGPEYKELDAGDRNLISKMMEFSTLYQAHKQDFSTYKTTLVYAALEGKAVLPDKKAFIERCLKQFKVDFPVQDYHIKLGDAPRRAELGTCLFEGGTAIGSAFYVEDKFIVRVWRGEVLRPAIATANSADLISRPVEGTPQATYSISQEASYPLSQISNTTSQAIYSNPIFPRPQISRVPAVPEAPSMPEQSPASQNPVLSRTPTNVFTTTQQNTGSRKEGPGPHV
ncbi:hypothetical protein FOPE_04432 [Fonsecaea pedrosoi]|nr:hypothetical protein FOPE_04432 [Fonsecaea pedrosoi]